MLQQAAIPYCGIAPAPGELLLRWNFDPMLLAVLAVLFVSHAGALFGSSEQSCRTGAQGAVPAVKTRGPSTRRPARPSRWRGRKTALLSAGWLLLLLLLISPFCALTSALFAARAAHHAVLVALVAPLLVLSLPERWRHPRFGDATLAAIFAAATSCLWLWHAPAAYALALQNSAIYWIMEGSLALLWGLLWLAILSRATRLTSSIALLLASVMQMGLLGAILTFVRMPLYSAHVGVTEPFGLDALTDQQLAGLIMWVPASLPYLAFALLIVARHFEAAPKAEAA